MSKQLRLLKVNLPSVDLRTETFEGDVYTVVPVVALVGNTVVHGSLASTPELIPESVLNIAPASWDGRPVVYSHPDDGSANTPENLESMKIGYIFNTEFDDGKLKMEAWLNEGLAGNADASELFSRLQGGDPIEVSVGSWTMIQQHSGVLDGESYDGVWSVAIPDHLAFLPPGSTGACSIEMGCGAPRLNSEGDAVDIDSYRTLVAECLGAMPAQAADRVLARVGLGPDGVSGNELMSALFDELVKSDPAFDFYIEDLYQGDVNAVIYAAFEDGETSLRRRSYTISDNELVLDESYEDAHRVVQYVTAESSDDMSDTSDPTSTTGQDAQGDPDMSADETLVARLVAHEASPFTEAHIEQLSSFDDDTLTNMLTRCGEPAQVDDTPAEPVALTDEEWMESAPAHVRAMVDKYERKEKEERTALISKLTKSQTTFTESDLNDKDTAELEKLSAFVDEAISYEGRALNAVDDDPAPEAAALPDPWGLSKAS